MKEDKEDEDKINEHQEQNGKIPNADKLYIKSKKKWKDFQLTQSIIEALRDQNKNKPTKVQEETLKITLDKDRKKFNLLVRAMNGSGKTLAFLLPMISALEPNQIVCEDKTARGKVMKDQIFRPQGVIIIQNFLLQSQLNNYLKNFNDYGVNNQVPSLKFRIGILNNDGHKPGDIIVCMPQSFLNRHQRGNMKLDNCKFIAIDEIDDIYKHDSDSLAKLLKIVVNEQRPNLITCSATMEKKFIEFYKDIDPESITLNLNLNLSKEMGHDITLEGVKNYYKTINYEDSKASVYEYILKNLFKELYGNSDQKKPQVFMFFNSANDIYEFQQRLDALASDFTNEESKYLESLTRAPLGAKIFKDGKKVDMKHQEKEEVMVKFRNNETNILMCTNIMARGVDIRNAVFVINVCAPRQKQDIIDVDIYLHRVGRTGRHNDKGIALTIGNGSEMEKMAECVKKVHKIQIVEMEDEKKLVAEVFKCIELNG